MSGLTYPNISPVLFSIGNFDLRWYSLAYLVGIVFAWVFMYRDIKKYALPINRKNLDDMMFNITLGIILGGRIFYVLFYNFDMFLKNPLEIFAIWHGGMSFHGGLFGVIVAIFYSARKMKYPFWGLADMAAAYTPVGLFLGRLANFINDELWGRVSDVSWAVKFPSGGYLPRHPSQLYEAALEGALLFVLLQILWHNAWVRSKKGFVSGVFLLCYGVFRIIIEFFREPDAQLGFIYQHITMGQILSAPILALGVFLMWYALRRKAD